MDIKKVNCMELKKIKLFYFCIKLFVYLYQQNKILIKTKTMNLTTKQKETLTNLLYLLSVPVILLLCFLSELYFNNLFNF